MTLLPSPAPPSAPQVHKMPQTVHKSDIARAIDVLTGKGLPIGGVEIAVDGTVRVLTALDAKPKNRQSPGSWVGYENQVSGTDEGTSAKR